MGLLQGQLFRYAQQQALNAVFRVSAIPVPQPNLFMAIVRTPIGDLDENSMSMADPSIDEYPLPSGYARQNVTLANASLTSPSRIWNTNAAQWGPFTTVPGVARWGICTDDPVSNAGATIAAFLLGTPRAPEIGDTLVASAGNGNAGVGFVCQV
jgi:hypothetical protein